MNNFIVAEIGVNWDGDFDLAYDMILKSKECGCNAVKFQAFDEKIVRNHPEKSRLMKSSISKENIEKINDLAKIVGIEWFCTPMYQEAVEMVNPFVKRFKIRYFDGVTLFNNGSSKLLEQVFKTKKEVIISSQKSPKETKYFQKPNIKWLYCVPKYPCSLEELDFKNLRDFNGYSNHCPNIVAPLTAAILKSEIIEVHVTLNKSKKFIDNNVSFDFDELKNLVELIRQCEKINR